MSKSCKDELFFLGYYAIDPCKTKVFIMKRQSVYAVITGVLLSGLCGCGRIVDWGKRQFTQAKNIDGNIEVAKKFTRSKVVYDQLDTVFFVDALWLSDEVRDLSANLLTDSLSKSTEFKKTVIKRQHEESSRFIMFYLLIPYNFSFGERDSVWHVTLLIDGEIYSPIETKSLELTPVTRHLFGKLPSRFKNAYQCKFDAKDIDDYPLITNETKTITLRFDSITKEVELTWDLNELRPKK